MKCICCGSEKVKHKRDINSYRLYKCLNCTFVFVSPLPSEKDLVEFYNKSRVITNLKKEVQDYLQKFEHDQNNPKKDWFNHVLKSAVHHTGKEKLKILEIGSGYGYFLKHAKDCGHDVTGTEVTPEYANAVAEVAACRIIATGNAPADSFFINEQFDFIYMEHVFEHVTDPVSVLTSIKKLLKENGALFISVPNSSSLLAKVEGKFWPWACPPEHLYYYNVSSLTKIINANGFEVKETAVGDYYFRSIHQLYSLLPFINLIRRKVFKKANIPYPYTYPRKFSTMLLLMPYWLLLPLLKIVKNSGNELSVCCKLK